MQRKVDVPYFEMARLLLPPVDWEFLRRTLAGVDIPPQAAIQVTRLIERGWPVQYVLGREVFLNLEFLVFPGVFIPREETEQLVRIAARLVPAGARVLDVGCGIGAIGLSLRRLRPDVEVELCDISQAAIFNTWVNAKRLLGSNVRVFQCDMEDFYPDSYDVILSNPPYVSTYEDTHPLAYWEPSRAIFGGTDGVSVIVRALRRWGRIRRIGMVILELSENGALKISEMVRSFGFRKVEVFPDQFGVGRFLVIWH